MIVQGVLFTGQQDFCGRCVVVLSGLVSEAFRQGIHIGGALLTPTEPQLSHLSNGLWLRF